jgi:hypothetical protein
MKIYFTFNHKTIDESYIMHCLQMFLKTNLIVSKYMKINSLLSFCLTAIPKHPLKYLVHVPQLPLDRKCLLNLLRRNPRGNLRIFHSGSWKFFPKPRAERGGPTLIKSFWGLNFSRLETVLVIVSNRCFLLLLFSLSGSGF